MKWRLAYLNEEGELGLAGARPAQEPVKIKEIICKVDISKDGVSCRCSAVAWLLFVVFQLSLLWLVLWLWLLWLLFFVVSCCRCWCTVLFSCHCYYGCCCLVVVVVVVVVADVVNYC